MEKLTTIIQSVIMLLCINIAAVISLAELGGSGAFLCIASAVVIYFFMLSKPVWRRQLSVRLRILKNGVRLMYIFIIASAASVVLWAWLIYEHPVKTSAIVINITVSLIMLFMLFCAGMGRCFFTSVQLGIARRLLLICCAMIPILNIIVLIRMIGVMNDECLAESDMLELDAARAENEICKTKYPLLLIHGVFFRDFRFRNYWGRITASLKRNGAVFYVGNQQSALSAYDTGREIAERIKQIVEETGCEKVNIIAHSKGGIDARCAISMHGADKYVASLTTVCSPHRGCNFADYLLGKASEKFRRSIADKYNSAMKMLGDTSPDFLSAVTDLTASGCEKINEVCPDAQGVYYQSVGSKNNGFAGGKFPLNLSYLLVKYFDGANDGLVSVDSMKWGEKFIFLETSGKRGISHGDVIDLNRENIKDFDVREFYVKLVSDLKDMGY